MKIKTRFYAGGFPLEVPLGTRHGGVGSLRMRKHDAKRHWRLGWHLPVNYPLLTYNYPSEGIRDNNPLNNPTGFRLNPFSEISERPLRASGWAQAAR